MTAVAATAVFTVVGEFAGPRGNFRAVDELHHPYIGRYLALVSVKARRVPAVAVFYPDNQVCTLCVHDRHYDGWREIILGRLGSERFEQRRVRWAGYYQAVFPASSWEALQQHRGEAAA